MTLKATGKAIARALEIGCYFMEQESERVGVRTGTVEVVDDVVEKVDWAGDGEEIGGGAEGEQKKRKGGRKRKRGKAEEGPKDAEMGDGAENEIFMRTRKTSMIEITISSITAN